MPGSKFTTKWSITVKPLCRVCSGQETSFKCNWVSFNSQMAGSKEAGKEGETTFKSWFSYVHNTHTTLNRNVRLQIKPLDQRFRSRRCRLWGSYKTLISQFITYCQLYYSHVCLFIWNTALLLTPAVDWWHCANYRSTPDSRSQHKSQNLYTFCTVFIKWVKRKTSLFCLYAFLSFIQPENNKSAAAETYLPLRTLF